MSYRKDSSGVFRPTHSIYHRSDDYQEFGLEYILAMQKSHFWYAGRHKFIHRRLGYALKNLVNLPSHSLSALDLGGGCGGWIDYLIKTPLPPIDRIALGDSSDVALNYAKNVLPESIDLYHMDALNINLKEQWDILFLLDVIEHFKDDSLAFKNAYDALLPGGLLVVTAPALQCFWSFIDDYTKHQRRYAIKDLRSKAELTGFISVDVRYFMFLLSPLYWVARKIMPIGKTREQCIAMIKKEHAPLPKQLNALLSRIFEAEASLAGWTPFPWGTSIFGIFQKPTC